MFGNKGQSRAPFPMEKVELVHANLGPLHLELTLNGDSQMFHDELLRSYPKLQSCGGYELLRGSDTNNRELTVIAPPVGGYTALFLKSVVSHAKIYVRPLQADLPIDSALSENAVSGPQEICKGCNKSIALYQLGQHLNTCSGLLSSSYVGDGNCGDIDEMLCTDVDSDEELQQAIFQSAIEASSTRKNQTLEEVIKDVRTHHSIVIPANIDDWFELHRTIVDIRRNHIFEDGIKAAKREEFDPTQLLQVNFIGEPAIDAGGPSREFFQLFLQEIDRRLLISCRNGSKVFDHNVPSLQNLEFRISGQYVAMSILQGGPAFPVLSLPLYEYLCTRQFDKGLTISDEDVPIADVYRLLKQIEEAQSNEEMKKVFDVDENKLIVMETGYRGILELITSKETLMRVLRDYFTIIKIIPEIEQFGSGVEYLFNLKDYPEQMKQVFVYSMHNEDSIAKGYFKTFFEPHDQFSRVSHIRKTEEQAYSFLLRYIEECEDGRITTPTKMKVETSDFLAFVAGVTGVPPLGFLNIGKPKLYFTDAVLATASTCDVTLHLPRCHTSYECFKDYLTESLISDSSYGAP